MGVHNVDYEDLSNNMSRLIKTSTMYELAITFSYVALIVTGG